MTSLTKAGVAIRKSNMIGHAAAVYVCNGRGEMSRKDYRSVAEARRVAADVAKQARWPVHEDLKAEGRGNHFGGGSTVARGVAAIRSAVGGRAPAGSLLERVRSARKPDPRK